ncbi:hypothetical protein EJ05DRAFT_237880 [Pseudovirgaria hyperparasitica]|uniref:Uncharacterized protein n=1 Tax=Pseudovirgaria hyperparasitica TaxID=470096 RepID=A0A6A6VRK2_9PEZI|nr:uncharacterized protein EJ05DRAFT_237880 [Pseudovirgaria hyperparasitica]KAF2752785.1 hypothetical protein EJ05DRAFT_237880 [Pseudovirgaria hyperparasitica]
MFALATCSTSSISRSQFLSPQTARVAATKSQSTSGQRAKVQTHLNLPSPPKETTGFQALTLKRKQPAHQTNSLKLTPPPKSPPPSAPQRVSDSHAHIPILLGSPRQSPQLDEDEDEDDTDLNEAPSILPTPSVSRTTTPALQPSKVEQEHALPPLPASSSPSTPSIIIPRPQRPTLLSHSASVRTTPNRPRLIQRSASVRCPAVSHSPALSPSISTPRSPFIPSSIGVASRPSHPIRTSSLPPLDGDDEAWSSPEVLVSSPPQGRSSPASSAGDGRIKVRFDATPLDIEDMIAGLPDLERETGQLHGELSGKRDDLDLVEKELKALRMEGEDLLGLVEGWMESARSR